LNDYQHRALPQAGAAKVHKEDRSKVKEKAKPVKEKEKEKQGAPAAAAACTGAASAPGQKDQQKVRGCG
jgi:hypothetical protein